MVKRVSCRLSHGSTRVGCIDRREFGRSLTRTLPSTSDRFWAKCAASRRICRGVATASGKATPLPAGGLSNFVQSENPRSAVGRYTSVVTATSAFPTWECASSAGCRFLLRCFTPTLVGDPRSCGGRCNECHELRRKPFKPKDLATLSQ